ncbi:zinc finger protein 40 [Gadus chalcogrammus]|uniref:zinc finger protein 40 n=1 Tax=Gadus chalcogrammus TaxID=1042646 RepID=UPI0024C4A65D|nr:zinc finger protein 40 [Gadus chalcogrammus]
MPRTKQNHPKNLKDKIEEAQKELKDPTGSPNGISGSSRRNADNIKGLKRKKIVAENQLKKIPKSPVKKPLQSKKPDQPPGPPSETATVSCPAEPESPSQTTPRSPSVNRDPKYAQQAPSASPPEGTSSPDNEELKPPETSSSRPPPLPPPSTPASTSSPGGEEPATAAEASQPECSRSGDSSDPNFEGGSYNSNAPLEVLLKAMEQDFSTLVERKGSFPVQATGRPAQTVPVQPRTDIRTVPTSVNFGLQNQASHVQTYYFDTKGKVIGIASPIGSNVPTSGLVTQLQSTHQTTPHFLASSKEKQGLQFSFHTGTSTAITHAPVPSGCKAIPQSQPPVVHTCQSITASVPSTIQVPVTPGCNPVQMATVVNLNADQAAKDLKPKKQGKYVCEYCSRACAKPSVLLKHIRSHTGERPYPCDTCGFSFKTKSNLYKHRKSRAHAIKLGLVARSESGGGSGSLSQESDRADGTHSEAEESGDSDGESSTADQDPDSSQSSVTALSEASLYSAGTTHAGLCGEGDLSGSVTELVKPASGHGGYEPKLPAALPKVVVYPVNVSPLRADSPRVTDPAPEQAAAQRQREFQTANHRSSLTILSSLKEVDCSNASLDRVSEDEDQHCKSPLFGGHAQLQRQQATDFSQQQQAKCLLSPRSLGSTDSGYFSRSESADQAMSPPTAIVKITPPAETDVSKIAVSNVSPVVATVIYVPEEKKQPSEGHMMRPPLETKALSLEERISKLISDNEAVVDNKQLDSVKPRRTSLSRRGSIDSPKSYIYKDSFQFDLNPIGRRSSSSSDIPKSPFTPTDKSKPVFLLSVPSQYPPMDCLPITRSNSMPTTPGNSGLPMNVAPQPYPLRFCQSFDDKIGSLNDDVFSSAPSTPNPAIHSRTLVRQVAIEDFTTHEKHSIPTVRSMDEGYHGSNVSTELTQRSRSFEHGQDKSRRPMQTKGTMYECETCRNRYRKLENFENHKKFYCSELHGPKNKPVIVKESDPDVFQVTVVQPPVQRVSGLPGVLDQQTSIRKRRKMKSVGDDDDQSPTDVIPPCSVSFDSCQLTSAGAGQTFSHSRSVAVDIQPKGHQAQLPQIQLVARGIDPSDSRLSPIREAQISTSAKERGDLQRQGSGTSVIRHTNSLSRPNSFETSESFDRTGSPVDIKHVQNKTKPEAENVSVDGYQEKMSKTVDYGKQGQNSADDPVTVSVESTTPVHQSRLVRQNNIQVPEILVTEEPDREHDTQATEPTEKPAESFNWPPRSESLSKVPAEKLPPKKKRIRLAQMEQSSGESSYESSLSRSLSRDSSLSHCSSISASFDREEAARSESPSRGECVTVVQEPPGLSAAFNTLGVPGVMRRAASEQISCTQPSVEISCDYRSKSFDCANVSPRRSLSPAARCIQGSQVPQVPLIERRRGPLVRQMSLKINPEIPQHQRKMIIPLEKLALSNTKPLIQHRAPDANIVNKGHIAQPLFVDTPITITEKMVQSINLGSPTQQPQIYGLPHPWHQTSRVQTCQKLPPPPSQIVVSRESTLPQPSEPEERKSLVPRYQLQCSAQKACQTFSFSSAQGNHLTMPILTIPLSNPNLSVSKSSEVHQNVYMAQHKHLGPEIKTQQVVLTGGPQRISTPLPQILITHEQMNPVSSLAKRNSHPSVQSVDNDLHTMPIVNRDRAQTQTVSSSQTPRPVEKPTSLGSLHCTQKLASVTLCPQQEPTASSKRMLSPANSLDIYMEKHQKRAKDEHGVACLTDGRSVNYLNSKVADVTRQRKLTLVRQVCTTEPADSPIETEAPPLPEGKAARDSEATDVCKPMSPDSTAPDKDTAVVPRDATSAFSQTTSITSSNLLKPQDRSEEQRWTPAKSPIRPSSFHGSQGKLTLSASAGNSKDSHRLSFPSLKTATTFTWCFLMKRKPLHVPQTDLKTSAYAAWMISPKNPNPLGLPTKVVMSLFDSKQCSKKMLYTSAIKTSGKTDIVSYSSQLKDVMSMLLLSQKTKAVENVSKPPPETQAGGEAEKDVAAKAEPRRVKIFDGGYKSNEEYVYVRGRGRGKYICEECGIRCKKPSMLRKHIRTHSDVRPYHCIHCNFSFKTKGNLTKHMKSKAHSKKCQEIGVPVGLIDDQDAEDSAGDRGHAGSSDRQDSDGDDSDGADDEDNDEEEEEEEESGLSTNPSVSASPQHLPPGPAEIPPSALLAQMSISSMRFPSHAAAGPPPPVPDPPVADCYSESSVAMMSPVSLYKQMSISGSCSSPGPFPLSPPALGGPLGDHHHASDTDSVHMMSPVSPCRQMSIDYPDFEVPPSPPVQSKGSKLSQEVSPAPVTAATPSEPGFPVDRGTQTSSFPPGGPMHFPLHGLAPPPAGPEHHLFSHLPLHSRQPLRSPYSVVPVGGLQLLHGGLAGYSTFLPIQGGPVQLTLPGVSVIHRTTSPLPAALCSPPRREDGGPPHPAPCFPLGPAGMEALSLLGVGRGAGQGLTLNATLGLQVVAAGPPGPQGATGPRSHLPGLQILNISLPALIPSLGPLSALSPPPPSEAPAPAAASPSPLRGNAPPATAASSPPAPPSLSNPAAATTTAPAVLPRAGSETDLRTLAPENQSVRWPAGAGPPSSSSHRTAGGADTSGASPAGGAGGATPPRPSPPPPPPPQPQLSRHKMADVYDDENDASSDDEGRLVIAT